MEDELISVPVDADYSTIFKPKTTKKMLKAFQQQDTQNSIQQTPMVLLQPLQFSEFKAKKLDLIERVQIGRQVSPKAPPLSENGIFDSKVLSRQHAEIWFENNKVWIQDLGSSNGTFVNGERLSPEGDKSSPVELKNGDVLCFGVDIMNEDNQTVLYKKVNCQVSVILADGSVVAKEKEGTKDVALSLLQDEYKQANENQKEYQNLKNTMMEINKMLEMPPSPQEEEKTEEKENAAELKQKLMKREKSFEQLKMSIEKSVENSQILTTEIENLTLKLKEKDSELQKQKEEVKKVKQESEQFSVRLHKEHQEEMKKLKEAEEQKRNALQKDFEAVQNQLKENEEKQKQELLNAKEQLKKLNEAEQKVASLQTDLEVKYSIIKKFEEKENIFKLQEEEQKKQIQVYEQEIKNLNTQQQQKLAEQNKQNEQLKSETNTLRQNLEKAKKDLSSLKESKQQELKEKQDHYENLLKQVQTELEEAKAEIEKTNLKVLEKPAHHLSFFKVLLVAVLSFIVSYFLLQQ